MSFLTLRADNFLAALVMDNTVPVEDKYHVVLITRSSSFLGKDEISTIRRGAASSVRGDTVIIVAAYSTLCLRENVYMI